MTCIDEQITIPISVYRAQRNQMLGLHSLHINGNAQSL